MYIIQKIQFFFFIILSSPSSSSSSSWSSLTELLHMVSEPLKIWVSELASSQSEDKSSKNLELKIECLSKLKTVSCWNWSNHAFNWRWSFKWSSTTTSSHNFRDNRSQSSSLYTSFRYSKFCPDFNWITRFWKLFFVKQFFETCVTWKKQARISTMNL